MQMMMMMMKMMMMMLVIIGIVQACDGDSDPVSCDQRPGDENRRLRVCVSAGQEPGVRGRHGVRGTPRAGHYHRRLLRRGLLRDTSTHQDSASTPRPQNNSCASNFHVHSSNIYLNTSASFSAHLGPKILLIFWPHSRHLFLTFGLNTLSSCSAHLGLKIFLIFCLILGTSCSQLGLNTLAPCSPHLSHKTALVIWPQTL